MALSINKEYDGYDMNLSQGINVFAGLFRFN